MPRKISAHYIFPGNANPLKLGIVVIDDDGMILDLIDTSGKLPETEKLEFFNGIITPGFINAHTHLELSHLKGRIKPHTGLSGFIKAIGQLRNDDISEKSLLDADRLMRENGTVAAGDISNSALSFPIKCKSKIKYHTFIEIFGFQDKIAREKMELGITLFEKLKDYSLEGSITPHAPYSMSESLWQMISDYDTEKGLIWSVHNQESDEENQLFRDKTGEIATFLSLIAHEFADWQAKGMTSLQYCRKFYENISKTLLIHNTFTSSSDLACIANLKDKIVLVLCPNANLYIENQLPDIRSISTSGFVIALGTDSLASNTTLSILSEMKTIQQYFPEIKLQNLIDWATINGAMALGFESIIGTIQKGKKPGLNLITDVNFHKMQLTSQSEVKVLV
ncbi:MAG TPA: amidohydrolase family protein [Bacteroidales bacterium]